jgi:PAS domain S-box-containing protein
VKETLQGIETCYPILFNNVLVGICVASYEGKILACNDFMLKMTGYSEAEIKQINLIDTYQHPEDRARLLNQLQKEGFVCNFEVVLKRKDGTPYYASLNITPFNLNGKEALLTVGEDITQRKLAEQLLKESEERYRTIFENTGTATAIGEEDTTFSLVNTEWEKLFGYSTEFVPKKELDRLKEYHCLRRIDPNAAPRHYETRIVDREGKIKNVLVTIDIIPGTKRHVVSLLDITERKRMEEELKQYQGHLEKLVEKRTAQLTAANEQLNRELASHKKAEEETERLLKAIETAREAISINSADGKIIYTNSAMDELFGYVRGELIGRHCSVLQAGAAPEARVKWLMDTVEKRGYWEGETHNKRKDGTEFISSVRIGALRDEDGKIINFISTRHDITKRKWMEERIKELYKVESKLRQELEEQIKQRVDFTRALVHELKTPLTAVVASSELLIEELGDEVGSRLAGNIYRGALNLDKRINELLDLARSEIGTLRVECKSLDALKVVNEVFEDMSLVSAKKGQSLVVLAVPESLPLVWADEERLRQILLNFISNALKFNRKGGRVILGVKEKGGSLVFEIQDEGEGIDKKDQDRLFQPYHRLERDRKHLNGLGLGLALSKALVELQKGEIWVESRKGKGSTFAFSLPIRVTAQPGSES